MARAVAILFCLALGAAGLFCVRILNPNRPLHRWVNPRATPRLLAFYWVLSWGIVIAAVCVSVAFATHAI